MLILKVLWCNVPPLIWAVFNEFKIEGQVFSFYPWKLFYKSPLNLRYLQPIHFDLKPSVLTSHPPSLPALPSNHFCLISMQIVQIEQFVQIVQIVPIVQIVQCASLLARKMPLSGKLSTHLSFVWCLTFNCDIRFPQSSLVEIKYILSLGKPNPFWSARPSGGKLFQNHQMSRSFNPCFYLTLSAEDRDNGANIAGIGNLCK